MRIPTGEFIRLISKRELRVGLAIAVMVLSAGNTAQAYASESDATTQAPWPSPQLLARIQTFRAVLIPALPAAGSIQLATRISSALEEVNTKPVVIPARETLSGLILDNYGISAGHASKPSFDRAAYLAVESKIMEINSLQSATELRAGKTLKLPILPSLARDVRDICSDESQVIRVSNATAKQLEEEGDNGQITACTSPAFARFDGPCDGQSLSLEPLPLNPADKQALVVALSKGTKSSTIFVLDSGWPDASSYTSSYADLASIMDRLWRTKFGVAPPADMLPKVTATFTPPKNCHVIEVAMAISLLDKLADQVPNSVRPKLIYIPLSKDQASTSFLRSWLFLGIAMHDTYAISGVAKLTSNDVRRWKSQVSAVLRGTPDILDNSPDGFKIDEWLVASSVFIGRELSRVDKEPFVVNESFDMIFSKAPLLPLPDDGLGGVMVTAVGQLLGGSIATVKPEYAIRAVSGYPDTVAVMNLNEDGGANCDTGVIDDGRRNASYVAGFSGDLVSGNSADHCNYSGTSFSTPRVAWMIAALEQNRPDFDTITFSSSVTSAIKGSRLPPERAPKFNDLWFSPARYETARDRDTSSNH